MVEAASKADRALGLTAGFDGSQVRSFLSSDRLASQVKETVDSFKHQEEYQFVGGVPHFKFTVLALADDQSSRGVPCELRAFEVPGAQDRQYFQRILSKLISLGEEELLSHPPVKSSNL